MLAGSCDATTRSRKVASRLHHGRRGAKLRGGADDAVDRLPLGRRSQRMGRRLPRRDRQVRARMPESSISRTASRRWTSAQARSSWPTRCGSCVTSDAIVYGAVAHRACCDRAATRLCRGTVAPPHASSGRCDRRGLDWRNSYHARDGVALAASTSRPDPATDRRRGRSVAESGGEPLVEPRDLAARYAGPTKRSGVIRSQRRPPVAVAPHAGLDRVRADSRTKTPASGSLSQARSIPARLRAAVGTDGRSARLALGRSAEVTSTPPGR